MGGRALTITTGLPGTITTGLPGTISETPGVAGEILGGTATAAVTVPLVAVASW